jgi:hypothetical protein
MSDYTTSTNDDGDYNYNDSDVINMFKYFKLNYVAKILMDEQYKIDKVRLHEEVFTAEMLRASGSIAHPILESVKELLIVSDFMSEEEYTQIEQTVKQAKKDKNSSGNGIKDIKNPTIIDKQLVR